MTLDCPIGDCDGTVRVRKILGKYHRRGREDLAIYEQARGECTNGHGPLLADRLPGGSWIDWRLEPNHAGGCVCIRDNRETCLGGIPA